MFYHYISVRTFTIRVLGSNTITTLVMLGLPWMPFCRVLAVLFLVAANTSSLFDRVQSFT